MIGDTNAMAGYRCMQAGTQSEQASPAHFRSRGMLMPGSGDFDDKFERARQMSANRIAQGKSHTLCCHVINQDVGRGSSQFVHDLAHGIRGIVMHDPRISEVTKSSVVAHNGTKATTGPSLGIGPVQPLQAGDVYALLPISGTHAPGTPLPPKSFGFVD